MKQHRKKKEADKMDDIIEAALQTKDWRSRQPWYRNGRHNECEKFQRSLVEKITGRPCDLTHNRIHMLTGNIRILKNPLSADDGFEWSETFDGIQTLDNGRILFYNLKMICSEGGSQTRSLREVFHFIMAQQRADPSKYCFINILDGDACHRHMNKLRSKATENIFVGDMKDFAQWFPSSSNKKSLGQFYTTRFGYILQGMEPPSSEVAVIEPFAGRGDLLRFLGEDPRNPIECYDIDPKRDGIIRRDVLMDPPDYNGRFVLTNPPFLSRNKSKDKRVFDRFGLNDLYKCFIQQLIEHNPVGGIVIIPLNFWCSSRASDVALRGRFLHKFTIQRLNIFEEKVFDDTAYTVCSFQFHPRTAAEKIPVVIFPQGIRMDVVLNQEADYLIGGHIHHLPSDGRYTVSRLLDAANEDTTRLLLKCIDDDTPNIGLRVLKPDEDLFYDRTTNHSERSYATLIISPRLSIDEQTSLASRFNHFLNEQRSKHHSLFLNNFREYGRKRITFSLAYTIIRHLLSNPNAHS